MKRLSIAGALALALGVAACGGAETTAENKQDAPAPGATNNVAASAASAAADQGVHSAEGDVTAVEGDQITISHGPIESLGWPAMTMSFRAESPQLLQGIAVGDSVSFQIRQSGGASVLTSISKR